MDSKFVLLLAASVLAFASPSYSYDVSCSRHARQLTNAAEEYESAASDFKSAKFSYEGACDRDVGYSKHDEGACGPSGYHRSSLESAQSNVKRARDKLEDAIGGVSGSCGTTPDSNVQAVRRACQSKMVELKEKLDSCNFQLQAMPR